MAPIIFAAGDEHLRGDIRYLRKRSCFGVDGRPAVVVALSLCHDFRMEIMGDSHGGSVRDHGVGPRGFVFYFCLVRGAVDLCTEEYESKQI